MTIKTYAQKSSAVRAAKKAHGEDYMNICSIKGSDADGWYIETEKVVTIEPVAPKLPEAITKAQAVEAQVAAEEITHEEADAIMAPVHSTGHVDIEAAQAAADAQANNELTGNPMNFTKCPKCGSEELYHGHAPEGLVIDENYVAGCHHCDWQVDIRKTGHHRPRVSTTDLPTKKVWHVADEMVAAAKEAGQPAPKRKEVIEECVRRGIAYGTARTQYQHWFKTMNDSAATPIAKINPDGSISYPGK